MHPPAFGALPNLRSCAERARRRGFCTAPGGAAHAPFPRSPHTARFSRGTTGSNQSYQCALHFFLRRQCRECSDEHRLTDALLRSPAEVPLHGAKKSGLDFSRRDRDEVAVIDFFVDAFSKSFSFHPFALA